jgi:NADPH:quinone reductase-like Zn-dependent oxidoreductase
MIARKDKILTERKKSSPTRTTKVEAAKALKCDVVIDKSQQDLWEAARRSSPNGYGVVADANGISTLSRSFRILASTGRLVVFGFHSNLPIGTDMLHPLNWLRMIWKMTMMPKFDAMDFVASNRSLLGFNLSFFVNEVGLLGIFYDQVSEWLESGKIQVPRVVEMDMQDISSGHALIQSGKSIGKIVMMTGQTGKI